MIDEGVAQPLLVTTSAITLACETVRSILKIDDIVSVRQFCNKFPYLMFCYFLGKRSSLNYLQLA